MSWVTNTTESSWTEFDSIRRFTNRAVILQIRYRLDQISDIVLRTTWNFNYTYGSIHAGRSAEKDEKNHKQNIQLIGVLRSEINYEKRWVSRVDKLRHALMMQGILNVWWECHRKRQEYLQEGVVQEIVSEDEFEDSTFDTDRQRSHDVGSWKSPFCMRSHSFWWVGGKVIMESKAEGGVNAWIYCSLTL